MRRRQRPGLPPLSDSLSLTQSRRCMGVRAPIKLRRELAGPGLAALLHRPKGQRPLFFTVRVQCTTVYYVVVVYVARGGVEPERREGWAGQRQHAREPTPRPRTQTHRPCKVAGGPVSQRNAL